MDVFGQKPASGPVVNKYVKRPIFTANFLEAVVNSAIVGDKEASLYDTHIA